MIDIFDCVRSCFLQLPFDDEHVPTLFRKIKCKFHNIYLFLCIICHTQACLVLYLIGTMLLSFSLRLWCINSTMHCGMGSREFVAIVMQCLRESFAVLSVWYCVVAAGIFHVPSHMNKQVVDICKRMLTVDPLKRATVKEIRSVVDTHIHKDVFAASCTVCWL